MNPILIVDDNEQILEILTQYIRAEGWPYLTAARMYWVRISRICSLSSTMRMGFKRNPSDDS